MEENQKAGNQIYYWLLNMITARVTGYTPSQYVPY